MGGLPEMSAQSAGVQDLWKYMICLSALKTVGLSADSTQLGYLDCVHDHKEGEIYLRAPRTVRVEGWWMVCTS